MKKIAITLVVLGFAFMAKAQQLQVLPKQQPLQDFRFRVDSNAMSKFLFNLPDSLKRNDAMRKKLDSLRKQRIVRVDVTANANVDNMPIVRLRGNSNMHIVQTDRTGYNMPVAGMRQPEVYIMKKPGANVEVSPANNKEKK